MIGSVFSTSQPILHGSPQASPAIIVSIWPPTGCSAPSFACAVRNRQSALLGSTMGLVFDIKRCQPQRLRGVFHFHQWRFFIHREACVKMPYLFGLLYAEKAEIRLPLRCATKRNELKSVFEWLYLPFALGAPIGVQTSHFAPALYIMQSLCQHC